MATTHVSGEIKTVNYTASGADISSGDVVILASTDAKKGHLAIATTDIADGSTGALARSGVWTMTKVSAGVIAQGEAVSWDASGSAVDDNALTGATGDLLEFGEATAAAAATTTTCTVDIEAAGTYTA